MSFKVIIAGSRGFQNYDLLKARCDNILKNQSNIEIVSGGADGADRLGERYAAERNYPIKRFIPDWSYYGRKAGFIRNEEMAQYGDALIAFWNGNSRGTHHMIETAIMFGLKIRIIRY